jgi:hypothetical protein
MPFRKLLVSGRCCQELIYSLCVLAGIILSVEAGAVCVWVGAGSCGSPQQSAQQEQEQGQWQQRGGQ